MHPADIQAALKKVGQSQTTIAKRNKVSRTLVSHVIHGRGKSRRIAKAISSATGRPVEVLWPGIYDGATRSIA